MNILLIDPDRSFGSSLEQFLVKEFKGETNLCMSWREAQDELKHTTFDLCFLGFQNSKEDQEILSFLSGRNISAFIILSEYTPHVLHLCAQYMVADFFLKSQFHFYHQVKRSLSLYLFLKERHAWVFQSESAKDTILHQMQIWFSSVDTLPLDDENVTGALTTPSLILFHTSGQPKHAELREKLLNLRRKFSPEHTAIVLLLPDYTSSSSLLYLKLGADAVMPHNEELIPNNLSYLLENFRLQSELLESSSMDTLTQLPSPSHFTELCEKLFAGARRGYHEIAIASLQIRNYETLATEISPVERENFIIRFTKTLKENVRQSDVLSYYGNGKFMILWVNMNPYKSHKHMEKIQQFLSNVEFSDYKPKERISVSCGISLRLKSNLEMMLQEANNLLKKALETGVPTVLTDVE
jgi:diguanylate cyclase (GGDEF)-like protein